MDFKTINFEDETEFETMLNKMHNTQLNSTLLDSPSSVKYGLESLSGSPCSPKYMKSPKYKSFNGKDCVKSNAFKNLSFSPQRQQEDEDDICCSGEIDLNKTYSSKTMDPQQLSLMLAALEEDEED